MGDLSIRPWKRYGHDRLYIIDTDDDHSIGYYDQKTGALFVEDEHRRYEAAAALRPHLPGPLILSSDAASMSTPSAPLASQPTPEPDHQELSAAASGPIPHSGRDLALKAAGAEAAAVASQLAPHGFMGLLARLLRLETEATSWQIGAKGEAQVGRRLERLERRGWRVLHAIPLPSGADIDHLVIGPGGVFTVNTKFHADARITVGTHVVWVNGFQHPYLRNSRHEAAAAQRKLTAALGFSIAVQPVLAFLGARSLTMRDAPPDVLIASGETADRALRGCAPELDDALIQRIYAVARRESTWLG